MPTFSSDISFDETSRLSDGAATQSEIAQATKHGERQERGLLATLGGALTFGAVDLVDTVASSIPGISQAFSLQRGDVNDAALNALDMPGLRKFYYDHEEAIEATSGVYGIVASELLTRKITTVARPLLSTVSKLPYVRRIAALDQQYKNAMVAVRNVDRSLAKRGALGEAQYAGSAVVDFKAFDAATGTFQRTTQTLKRSTARRNALALGAAKGARHAVAVEATMAFTLNQNSFLYEDDAAHNLMWMGLGVATAGAIDWVGGAYELRRFVNSDEIRRTFAGALDPEGSESARLLWHGKEVKPAEDYTGFLGGKHTDEITSLLVGARQLTESKTTGIDSAALSANREKLATQQMQLAMETAQKVVNRGISSNGLTRFTMDTPEYGNHIRMIMNEDPTALYGAEMVAAIPEGLTAKGVHEAHVARLSELQEQFSSRLANGDSATDDLAEIAGRQRKNTYEQELTPVVYLDGEAATLSEASAIEKFVEPELKFTAETQGLKIKNRKAEVGDKNPHGLWEARTDSRRSQVSIDTKLTVHIPGKKNLNTADHFDMLRLYRVADKAIDQMSRFTDDIIVPENPTWFQLDMIEEVLTRSQGEAKVKFPAGMSRESAQVESLAQKAEAMRKQISTHEAGKLRKKGPVVEDEDLASQLRVRYNLPKLTAYEKGVMGQTEHAVEKLLRGIGEYGPDEVRKMTLSELKETTAAFKRLDDIAPVSAKDEESLSGNSFKYMLDREGNPIKPLLMYKRPFRKTEWSQGSLDERLAANKILTMNKLTNAEAPMTREISNFLANNPDFDQAARTHELIETQIQGSVASGSQQGFFGALAKGATTSEFRDRDSKILLAATRIREAVNRQSRAVMQQVITGAFGDTLGQLRNIRNAKSELLLNQFHSFRGGWDLAKDVVTRKADDGSNLHVFPLKDTVHNKSRWKQAFGTEMPKGQVLTNLNGVEVALDDLGMDIQSRFNQVSSHLAGEKNALLSANGARSLDMVDHYTPPPNTSGKLIGFVLGPDNSPVPGMSIIATTQKEFAKKQAQLNERLQKLGVGYRFKTQDDIKEFASIWDKLQMDLIDPGVTAVQPKKTNKGLLTEAEINHNAFNESLQYLQNGYLRHGDDIIETVFKEQINSAKSRSTISTALTRNKGNAFNQRKYKNIYDYYLENLTGRNKLANESSIVGAIYNPIEGFVDGFFEGAAPMTSKVWDALSAWTNKGVTAVRGDKNSSDFDKLSKELGQYMPFESAAKFVESKTGVKGPWTSAEVVGNINQFTAATMLRMIEVAHPIMNLTGIVNAMPAVIRSYQPKAGESTADFAARIGHNANIFELGDGRTIANIDMAKVSANAAKRTWSRESHPDYDYMVRNGYLNQEVAEFHRQFGAIESKSAWKSFFMGDENRKGISNKGVVGWLSVLSDKSEDFSRSWGHMTGLEIADSLGIKGLEARNAFAHDVANKMIANYSPHNRPEIFQGPVGASLGLFQSFILNYYQRLFRYAETGDGASFGLQYATQAGLFGVTSLTGWTQFNNFFMDAADGETDPSSGIWRKFGGEAGDLLGSGVISNIPKLFGGDGVDLYSRGDTNVRLPGFNGLPGFSVLGKVAEGVKESISAFWNNHDGLTGTQMAEIWSNTLPNRPLAGMIEYLGADGNDTDRYGQLVQDTQGALEATYRMLGVRSMRQSQQINAFYANKSAMEHKASADEVLRLSTRAAIRDGSFDSKADGIFSKYVENGGDPRNFRRWIKGSIESATTTTSERQLKETLANPAKLGQSLRLIDAGVGITEDEETPDDYYGQDEVSNDLTDSGDELGSYEGQLTIP